MEEINKLKKEFEIRYKNMPDEIYFAPGRVNLIGEHIDYNGGLVFPCALTVGTYLAVRKREDDRLLLQSLNFDEKIEVPLSSIEKTDKWFDYPLGIISSMIDKGAELSGMEILYYGTIPNGSGLSSSASIEVVTAYAINSIAKMNFDTIELAKLSQKVENEYVGVSCGIMDQFAVAMGKSDHAIALDCNTLEYEYVPVLLENYALIISNTKVERKLAGSKYNERLAECKKALDIVKQTFDVNHLCELSLNHLQSIKDDFEDEVIYRRARHVVSEQGRVEKAIKLLKQNDLLGFGELMNKSHDSLKEDYEVTGDPLDTMVYEGRKINGVIGSRMTGAGFGGCTITLLHKDSVDIYKKTLGKVYESKMNLKPEFYEVGIGNGVMKIQN